MLPKGKAGGYIALSITSIVWGTTWAASKIGVNEMPALQMASIRQFMGGFCFVFYFIVFKKMSLPSGRQFIWLIIMALLMFVFANGLSTWSLKFIPTGLSALIGALYPLSVVLIERTFFKTRKISNLTLTGLLLGIAGVAIVFYESAFQHRPPNFIFGVMLSVMAMLSWSAGTIFIVRNKVSIDPYYGTGWQMLVSSVVLFIFAHTIQPTIPLREISSTVWMVLAYLVLAGSLLSFAAFIYSMKQLPVAISSLYAYFNPIVAMITAAILVNEKLTANIIWGTVVTLSGVFLVNLSSRHTNTPMATEPEQ